MKRAAGVAATLGLANAAVAVGVLYLMSRWQSRGSGWFAYAPLTDQPLQLPGEFDWTYVVLPAALLLLNLVLVVVASRVGGRRCGRSDSPPATAP